MLRILPTITTAKRPGGGKEDDGLVLVSLITPMPMEPFRSPRSGSNLNSEIGIFQIVDGPVKAVLIHGCDASPFGPQVGQVIRPVKQFVDTFGLGTTPKKTTHDGTLPFKNIE